MDGVYCGFNRQLETRSRPHPHPKSTACLPPVCCRRYAAAGVLSLTSSLFWTVTGRIRISAVNPYPSRFSTIVSSLHRNFTGVWVYVCYGALDLDLELLAVP